MEASHNWHGGSARNEVGIFSFHHFQPFFAARCLAFCIVGPPGLQKPTEVLHHDECAGTVGPRPKHGGCGIMCGAAGKLGVDFKFNHGTVTGEERARRERDLKP